MFKRFSKTPAPVFEVINLNKEQPKPKEGDRSVIYAVQADLVERAILGKEKYGTLLQTENGRDSLLDAYEEALDLAMYLKQVIMERDSKKNLPGFILRQV